MNAEHFDVHKKNCKVAGLPVEDMAEIAELAEYRVFTARDNILERGARGVDLFVILDGNGQILNPNGEKLSEVGPRSVVGEVALVDDGPQSAGAVGVATVQPKRLPGPVPREYMFDRQEYGFVMLAALSRVLSVRSRGAPIEIDDRAVKAQDSWRLAFSAAEPANRRSPHRVPKNNPVDTLEIGGLVALHSRSTERNRTCPYSSGGWPSIFKTRRLHDICNGFLRTSLGVWSVHHVEPAIIRPDGLRPVGDLRGGSNYEEKGTYPWNDRGRSRHDRDGGPRAVCSLGPGALCIGRQLRHAGKRKADGGR